LEDQERENSREEKGAITRDDGGIRHEIASNGIGSPDYILGMLCAQR
jgi:hypothetical protein